MNTKVLHVIMLTLIAMVLCGCGQSQRRQQMVTMGEIKNIALAKLEAESAGKPLALSEICNALSIDASKYEATEAWANPQAVGEAVILREKTATGGQRVVALANGSVVVR